MPNRLNISPLIIRLSKFISNFFNPLTSLILFLIYKNYRINDLNQAVKEIFPILRTDIESTPALITDTGHIKDSISPLGRRDSAFDSM